MNILIFWDRGAPAGLEIPVYRIISQILDIPASVCESPVLYNGFDRTRNQFDASEILTCLDIFSRRNGEKNLILLVIGDDIYRQNTRYVFGLSRPATGTAVISSARLKNEYWGLPSDEMMLVDRLSREGAHELGHLLHLDHCDNPSCIMANPLTLDDLDNKKSMLCHLCLGKIQRSPITVSI
ncbi:archaemetzincin [Methanospirillum sp. J.3.6.1-F.2.7.3]|jgi:archaemetzincin|uniref:Archaemetzincin n=1 Tax=Methanospirillum purgamenti TaxID=2834276 RepID=A0A8E7EG73_9EURY|nr:MULTISPECIES: archaemetzincin family Zn-dependent metalloprotease [Methanospirillum]MDX8550956.1 archaemetzincin family Zn-dependent metalloprotease [Methanospirillum hungatei]QVV87537.1 archaemetzincin [Methanospirillum sp. J.3.6.1-F.2.7.3]